MEISVTGVNSTLDMPCQGCFGTSASAKGQLLLCIRCPDSHKLLSLKRNERVTHPKTWKTMKLSTTKDTLKVEVPCSSQQNKQNHLRTRSDHGFK